MLSFLILKADLSNFLGGASREKRYAWESNRYACRKRSEYDTSLPNLFCASDSLKVAVLNAFLSNLYLSIEFKSNNYIFSDFRMQLKWVYISKSAFSDNASSNS